MSYFQLSMLHHDDDPGVFDRCVEEIKKQGVEIDVVEKYNVSHGVGYTITIKDTDSQTEKHWSKLIEHAVRKSTQRCA